MADLCTLYLEGKVREARDLYYRVLPLCHALFYETNPAPVKAALKMMGMIASDEVRLPLVPMQPANRERLKKVIEDYGLI
jgi:4-hydroxy-tetrahydrodipicolinate synthase